MYGDLEEIEVLTRLTQRFQIYCLTVLSVWDQLKNARSSLNQLEINDAWTVDFFHVEETHFLCNCEVY